MPAASSIIRLRLDVYRTHSKNLFGKKVMEGDYPPAPSTPPEPAPPDPSLSTAARDPRSNDRRLMIQQGLDGVGGLRRLVKASTMPVGGSHTSLEDITCNNLQKKAHNFSPIFFYFFPVSEHSSSIHFQTSLFVKNAHDLQSRLNP